MSDLPTRDIHGRPLPSLRAARVFGPSWALSDPPPRVQWLGAMIVFASVVVAVLLLGAYVPGVWQPIVTIETPGWVRWVAGISLVPLGVLAFFSFRALYRRDRDEWIARQKGGD